MDAPRAALFLACSALLAGSGCQENEDPGPPDDRGALLQARIGTEQLAGIPLLASFAPASPFVRRPLFLVETPPRVPLILSARVLLDGVGELSEALGKPWPIEGGFTLQRSGDPTPLVLGWGELLLEPLAPRKSGRPRVRGRMTGMTFTHAGEERPFEILFEAPVVQLDGRLHAQGR